MITNTLHGWFADSVQRAPDLAALVVAGEEISYAELDALSCEYARWFQTVSSTPRVGLLASRSVVAYAAYLAALRAGGVVVPLNHAYPPERNARIAQASGLDIVVVDDGQDASFAPSAQTIGPRGMEAWPAAPQSAEPAIARPGGPDDLAYVLFTSGSTGRPKGVPIRHQNLDAFLRYNIARYEVRPGCRLSQTFDLTFDPSVFDMFVAWGSGATLVVPSREELFDPVVFVNDQQITHWYSVPSLVSVARHADVLSPGSMPSLRWSLFAGDQLTFEQAEAWALAAPNSDIENLYGPTELSVTVSAYRLPRERSVWPRTRNGTVPIGQVYPHLEYRVAADGELWVRGAQRFGGYLDPADNQDRFVSSEPWHDVPGADAWYRTGDRVAVQNGNLVHLGRLDHQVKILGQRVELQEVESALRAFAGVGEVVVVALPDKAGGTQLAAVYSGSAASSAELTAQLRARLPSHMIPRRYLRLDRLPLNANGKVDRSACGELARSSRVGAGP